MTTDGWTLFDSAINWATGGSGGGGGNTSPSVNAGADQTLATGSTTASLDAAVTDDGQPAPANLTYTWTQVSGPSTATITSAAAEDTGVTGLATGSYVFQLNVSDGALNTSDTVQVTVGGTVVDAGTDQTVTQTGSNTVVQLAGAVTPATTVTWSGPAGVSFSTPSSLTSTVSISTSGQYTLTLTASDGATDTVKITVDPPATENPTQIIRKFYSLSGMAVATRTLTDYPTLTDTDQLQWLVSDQLGSVTGVVNQDLSSAYKAWYYPYGTTRGETGATGIDQSFTGQTTDPGTGLIDYNARQYDPLIGRFIQQDSIVPSPTLSSDLNRFMYVRGNPLSLTDPSGNETCFAPGRRSGYTSLVEDCYDTDDQYSDAAAELDMMRQMDYCQSQPDGYCTLADYMVGSANMRAAAPPVGNSVVAALVFGFFGVLTGLTVVGDIADGVGCARDVGLNGSCAMAALPLASGALFRGLDEVGDLNRALPSGRRVDGAWGAGYYRRGGFVTSIEHVNYRHAFDSGFSGVSKFSEGTSARQIKQYVGDAFSNGSVSSAGGTGIRVVYDTGGTIGTDAVGEAVSGIEVIIDNGVIRSAYPVAVP